MSDLDEKSSYFLLRAKQEEQQAAKATKAEAAKAHRELAMRYSIKALLPPDDDQD